ncbi:hypothetical protein P171DRAFT_204670 [Karstenula rhodostoma CBS 690.94]|uniref:Uncharacterized protein n=1 Tax=Karstenula rhodostoma CBS 690.94 TaxID=1392251 RepID=A0A9P4PRQ3_9PLEO|nr:hypothetical protein P171DRAFT_204670 [Karstenula rhodostoma CBS 690.94]
MIPTTRDSLQSTGRAVREEATGKRTRGSAGRRRDFQRRFREPSGAGRASHAVGWCGGCSVGRQRRGTPTHTHTHAGAVVDGWMDGWMDGWTDVADTVSSQPRPIIITTTPPRASPRGMHHGWDGTVP